MASTRPSIPPNEMGDRYLDAGLESFESTGLANSHSVPDALYIAVFQEHEAKRRAIQESLILETSWTVRMVKKKGTRRALIISRITEASQKLEEYKSLAVHALAHEEAQWAAHMGSGSFIIIGYPRIWDFWPLVILFLSIYLLVHPVPMSDVNELLDKGTEFMTAAEGLIKAIKR